MNRPTEGIAESFTEWLSREMPPGTVIGDPKWWAVRILHAVQVRTPLEPSEDARNAEIYKWRLEQVRELCTTGLETMPTLEFFAWSVLHWIGRYPPEISEALGDQSETKGATHE